MEDLQSQITSSCATPTTTAPVEDPRNLCRLYLDASILTPTQDALAASTGVLDRKRSASAGTVVRPGRRLGADSLAQTTPRRMSAELACFPSQCQTHVAIKSQHHMAIQPQPHVAAYPKTGMSTQSWPPAVSPHVTNPMQHLTPRYASLPTPSTTPRSSAVPSAKAPVTPRRCAPEAWSSSRVQVPPPGARAPPVQVETQQLPVAPTAFRSWQPPTRSLHVT